METKTIAKCGVVAAMYVVVTIALAPISYGPIQFRVSELIKPLALFDPEMALAFALGTGISNIMSPFGPWDYIVMAVVDGIAAFACWKLRKYPWLSLVVQSLVISIGVAVFPLWLGGGISPILTFPGIMLSETVILLAAYAIIWRPRTQLICHYLN